MRAGKRWVVSRLMIVFVAGLALAASSMGRNTADGKAANYWVAFTDKGTFEALDHASLVREAKEQGLTEAALERRRVEGLTGDSLVTLADLPPDQDYLNALTEAGARVRVVSRWFNRASVSATPDAIAAIEELPFVAAVSPVAPMLPTGYWYEEEGTFDGNPAPGPGIDTPGMYGPSYLQDLQLNAVEAHRLGYTGRGVLMGVIDSGFELSHEAFARLDVVATWDTFGEDDNVGQEPGDAPGQTAHGTGCLSTIAGYSPGNLIGTAYEASFLLAKTENVASETPVEEDNYVAALEWMERLGVRVTSSSLGYTDWYNEAMMDGETPITSRAINRARKMGVVCCTSASNEGPQPRTLGAPGDNWGGLTVGAVDSLGAIARFSSRGPTADGRTKPDIVARGVRTVCVSPFTNHQYSMWNGTSLSTPVAAGAVALVRGAHPDWGAARVIHAVKSTSDRADHPDNVYGWGLPDVIAAINYDGK